jgi:TfoX/Sxy family transcriptional regulator of competence genes
MAYNEQLAERVRRALAKKKGVTERKMFGGLAFMLGGNMCCGIVKDELMVRVGAAQHEKSLALPGAHPMDFTGRPMKGMVFVGRAGYRDDKALAAWVKRGADYAASLPAK